MNSKGKGTTKQLLFCLIEKRIYFTKGKNFTKKAGNIVIRY